jgi:hypothetical protein
MRALHASISCVLLLACLACAPGTAPPAVPPRPELGQPQGEALFDLRVDAPVHRRRVTTPVPWLEVRGRTGFAELFESDVVIVLDLSNSSMLASGIDLDEDGVVGEDHRWLTARIAGRGTTGTKADRVPMHRWTSDSDDTVAMAELEAAHSIIAGLWSRQNRIGIVTYDDTARVRVRVGEPRLAGAAIDRIRVPREWNETDVSAALLVAQDLLESPELQVEPRRDRAILLFTDGSPTRPGTESFARARARRVAADAAAAGIRIYVLSFGNLDERRARFVVELAQAAKGLLVPVRDPKRLLQDLPPVRLAPEFLAIRNRTLERPARAVRSGRDGHFEGFVPLAEGENEIEITAVLGNGREARERRIVHYAPSAEPTRAERREAARLLVALRERTRELEQGQR